MDHPQYKIVRATVADRERILTFMRQHFYKYEPLSVSLGLLEGPSCTDLIFSLASLHEGTSLIAFDADDLEQKEIIGMCLNGETTRHREGEPEEDLVSKCPCPKYAKLLTFLGVVEEGGHIWKNTVADKVLDVHALAVDSSKRREGLGKALVEFTKTLAKDEGYQAISVHCTSHYSARLMEKLGMPCVFELRYDWYLGEDGYPVFKPAPPHEALKCYLHVLD